MRSAVCLVQASFLIVLTLAVTTAVAQEPIAKAQELYAAASYDEALALLDQMQAGAAGAGGADRRQIAYYRALCLLALGRSDDADRALEDAAAADPFYRLKDAEASPSVRARAEAARQRVLPAIARGMYNEVKDSFGRRDWKETVQRATELDAILNDPAVANGPAASSLADIRTLNAGFLEVSRKSLETAPLPTTALGNNPAPAAVDTGPAAAPVSNPAPPPATPSRPATTVANRPASPSTSPPPTTDTTAKRTSPPPAARTEGATTSPPPAVARTPASSGSASAPASKPASPPPSSPASTPPSKPASPPASSPASPPASKPASPPATSPASPPASKPASPPASKPALPPASSPATSGAPAETPAPTTSATPSGGVLVPPKVISQLVPAWPGGVTLPRDRAFRGTVRVTIDEQGRVESAVMMRPIHPMYDPILMDATRSWKYVAATRGGIAVKYVKAVDVTLVPPEND